MLEPARSPRLLVWSLATFHAAFFLLAVVTLLHGSGNLGNTLKNLNTTVGIALFGILWLTSWWCTRRAAHGIAWATPDRAVKLGDVLAGGIVWGGVNGVLFLLAIVLVRAFADIAQQGPTMALITSLVGVLFVFLFGGFVAFLVGAFIGLLLAILDSIVLELSRRIFLVCRGEVEQA